jgi:hypothetical protein
MLCRNDQSGANSNGLAMTSRNYRCRTSVLAAMVLSAAPWASQANAQQTTESDPAMETLQNGQQEAALYSLRRADGGAKAIVLNENSLLRWHNSVNQSVYGNIFIWLHAGRPELVASIYRFYEPKVEFAAEFQSLSLAPLVMEKGGKEVWTPKRPGIVFEEFPGAASPSQSKPQRLLEMRNLAEQFSVQLTDWSGETYLLRMMPRPLVRYESPESEVLDGALFAFTYTTDPELLVMVEARKSSEGHRWMYGLARMNIGELKVSYRDREIWTAERLEHPYLYKDGVYTLFMNLPLPSRP